MLKGEAKKEYQREYMRDYMRKRRAVKTLVRPVKTSVRPYSKENQLNIKVTKKQG